MIVIDNGAIGGPQVHICPGCDQAQPHVVRGLPEEDRALRRAGIHGTIAGVGRINVQVVAEGADDTRLRRQVHINGLDIPGIVTTAIGDVIFRVDAGRSRSCRNLIDISIAIHVQDYVAGRGNNVSEVQRNTAVNKGIVTGKGCQPALADFDIQEIIVFTDIVSRLQTHIAGRRIGHIAGKNIHDRHIAVIKSIEDVTLGNQFNGRIGADLAHQHVAFPHLDEGLTTCAGLGNIEA